MQNGKARRLEFWVAAPLFVIGPDGQGQIVNTRVRGNVLIVDQLFGAAELRLGEVRQDVVRILQVDGVEYSRSGPSGAGDQ